MFPINDSILSEVKYSPFAYDKHAKLFYTDDITSPSKDRGKFIDESIDLVKKNIGYFSRKGFDFVYI